ncbi:MAG: hypothetical protein HYT98_05050 [Candidatus Sungbacteria bacterium]|nr:hypothetical protein [Candidatus Sungbacteria bacterium]
MVFVLIRVSRLWDLNEHSIKEIERKCKEAWVSMNQCPDRIASGPFSDMDVGGIAIEQHTGAKLHITFIYNDRGEEFYHQLRYRLYQQLESFRIKLDVEVIPTKPNMWFADPSWATSPCERPHIEPHELEDDIPW